MVVPDSLDPGKPDFILYTSPFYLIAHADFKFHEDLDNVLIKHGIVRSTYRLLTVLREAGSMSIKELSERALLKRSTVSRAVGRMRRDGWVATSFKGTDNRVTEVYLTKEGKKAAERSMHLGSRQLHRAVEGISATELRRLVSLLQQIISNLSKLPLER